MVPVCHVFSFCYYIQEYTILTYDLIVFTRGEIQIPTYIHDHTDSTKGQSGEKLHLSRRTLREEACGMAEENSNASTSRWPGI